MTIPELGTIVADEPPIVIITTNRTREIHDALKRRCLYHWVDYPSADVELEIVRLKVPGCEAGTVAAGGGLRAEAAADGPFQEPRRRRDHRLGHGRLPNSTGWRSIRRPFSDTLGTLLK